MKTPEQEYKELKKEGFRYVLYEATYESLTKYGEGVYLGQLCYWCKIPTYGTRKQKAERLLKWRDKTLLKHKEKQNEKKL